MGNTKCATTTSKTLLAHVEKKLTNIKNAYNQSLNNKIILPYMNLLLFWRQSIEAKSEKIIIQLVNHIRCCLINNFLSDWT